MAKKHYIEWVERKGRGLRRLLRLSATDVLDPYDLARVMQIAIVSPYDIVGMTRPIINQLLINDNSSWSAGSLCIPDGRVAVILNPTHADTRSRATLMEELAHVYLGHEPSNIVRLDSGIAFRSYNKTNEGQAYWVGAAALVTSAHLSTSLTQGKSRKYLAKKCGVSVDLVKFRENVTGIRLS